MPDRSSLRRQPRKIRRIDDDDDEEGEEEVSAYEGKIKETDELEDEYQDESEVSESGNEKMQKVKVDYLTLHRLVSLSLIS